MARCFMSRISRIIAATIAAVLSALPVYAQKPLQTDVNIPWEEIGRIAREFRRARITAIRLALHARETG